MEVPLKEEQLPDVELLTRHLQQADRRLEELKHKYHVMLCIIAVLAVWSVYLLTERRQHVTLVRQWSEELAIWQDKVSALSSNVDDLQAELADLDGKPADWKDVGPEVEKISGNIQRDVTDLDERIEKLEDRMSDATSDDESDE